MGYSLIAEWKKLGGWLFSTYVESRLHRLICNYAYRETHNAVLDAVDELGIMRLLKQRLEEYQAL